MCGIFGVWGAKEASSLIYRGLFALQHRGQESAGIVVSDGKALRLHRGMGLVAQAFTRDDISKLKGSSGIGHIRYSTAGLSRIEEAQPLLISCSEGQQIAIAHNGNILNSGHLKGRLEREGSIFQTTSDSEVILHRIARAKTHNFISALISSLSLIKGGYSLLFLLKDKMVAVRDPFGFRPLAIGSRGKTVFFASETSAFDLVGAKYIRDVEPGEMVTIDDSGMTSIFYVQPSPQEHLTAKTYLLGDYELPYPIRKSYCIFEHIYFARPDSRVFSEVCYFVRKMLGRRLGVEKSIPADVVISVPYSGTIAAMGYAEETTTPYELGLVRNNYIGRTFINPEDSMRKAGVEIKLNPVADIIAGKRVVVVDDSIVRGTTSRKIIGMIRRAGAREIHLRISSPPVKHPCYYGIDTPTEKELIAAKKSISNIRDFIGVDSLEYLSLEGMLSCVKNPENYCTACFSGDYPIL
ncbi:MAG: amidophosphoribosyltransferase [bacterium]